MNALLICPGSRPGVEHLTELAPLAALPLLGESLVEYWLTYLADRGVKQVRILAHDRPDLISARIGTGARWGLDIDVVAEDRELSPAQAQLKYAECRASSAKEVEPVLLDHLPGLRQELLFASYAHFFSGSLKWMPKARTPDRVGIREVRPGIWMGIHAHVAPTVQLHAPCWIGMNAYVGPRAVLGPMAILEDRAFIEPDAEISGSVIGPDTLVGNWVAIHDAFAWGDTLIHWKSGVCTRVEDAFLLSPLRHDSRPAADGLLDRLAEIYARNKGDLQLFWKNVLLKRQN